MPAGRVFTELRCQLREDDQQARCINGAAGSWFLCRTSDVHGNVPTPCGLMRMPLSPEQEELCERMEKGEPAPLAAALIRHQAQEIDDLSGPPQSCLRARSP